MTSVTFVGARLTGPGAEFIYHDEPSVCEGRPYRRQCLNFIEGVRYHVLDVYENTQVPGCVVHDESVRAVEVGPAPVMANVPSKGAYTRDKASPQGPCPHTECPSHEYYVPEGAEFDQGYHIHDVLDDPPHGHCHLDWSLTFIEFEPADE